MAGVDPYSPCPCGSGQKLKWCCHKAEPYALRSMRLLDGNQAEASIEALDEGLKKVPYSPWLTLRKASTLAELGRVKDASDVLAEFLKKEPKNVQARLMYAGARMSVSPDAAVDALQDALDVLPIGVSPRVARLIREVGLILIGEEKFVAARRHFLLMHRILDNVSTGPETAEEIESMREEILRPLDGSVEIAPWFKQDYDCLPAPEGTPEVAAARFREAMELVEVGRFRAAMALYHALTGELGPGTPAGNVAEYNEGLTRLYVGDHKGAVALLRRRVVALGHTSEAVDIELLCQSIEPVRSADRVEYVHWIWPIRNHDGLLAELSKQPDLLEEGEGEFDPSDENSADAVIFQLLDRPALTKVPESPLTPDQIPIVQGRLYVSKDLVALGGADDGRLEGLRDRFMAIAGPTIVPAHPKSKFQAELSRSALSISWEWQLPDGLIPREIDRLRGEKKAEVLTKVWPGVPKPYLNGRTPLQAAGQPEGQVPLRAALLIIALSGLDERVLELTTTLRDLLKLPEEPRIDLRTTQLEDVAYARFHTIDLETASVLDLAGIVARSEAIFLPWMVEQAGAQLLKATDAELDAVSMPRFRVHEALGIRYESTGYPEKAAEQMTLGRAADPNRLVPLSAMNWDLADLMLKMPRTRPEEWVPDLSVLLERYSQIPECAKVLSSRLVAMRLIQLIPHPERPDDFLLDTRRLQALLATYGPKVRTATGELGVSASKPAIWTPGSAAAASTGGGGGIWTPGSSAPPPQGGPPAAKSPLIIPGR